MTRKQNLFTLTLFLYVPVVVMAQESGPDISRRILLQASFAFRTPPVTLYQPDQEIRQVKVPYNTQDQLSGPGIRLGLGFQFPKNDWWIFYSHTFRYDAVYYHRYYTHPVPNSATVDIAANSLIHDMIFTVSKGIRIGKYDPFLTIGGGLMNRGTYYMVPLDYDTLAGQVIATRYTSGDFKFSGILTGVGIRYDDFMIELNAYWAYQEVYARASLLCIPEIRIGYSIIRKGK